MLPLKWLSNSERKEFELRLATGYEQRATITILTNEDKPVSTVSAWLMEGQVDVRVPDYDREAQTIEVSRSASLTLLDPDRELGFDSGSPSAGSMYLDRMIGIEYGVRCSFGWVDIPVFVGPVTSIERDGEMVQVEAQGKEVFGLSEANTTKPYKAKTLNSLVFVDLVKATGEAPSLIDKPSGSSKLTKSFSIAHESHRWFEAYRVARSMDRIAFYDGTGRVRTPPMPKTPAWTFAYGDGGMLLSLPKISYSIDNLKNVARVTGGAPKGSKKKASGYARAASSSALSPAKLGRRGVSRFLLVTDEDSSLTTKSKANARAAKMLADGLAQEVTTEFTALCVPHLEPWDIVVVNSPIFAAEMRVNNFSLPLTADGVMTVGFNARVSKPRIPRMVKQRRVS